MSTTIDAPGLAKVSRANLIRDLHNERQRKLRGLKRAQLKLAGLQALKKDLQPYLQPGDYEHIEDRLQGKVTQKLQEETELADRLRQERYVSLQAGVPIQTIQHALLKDAAGEAVARVARHLSCTLLALRSVPAKSASLAVCDV